MPVFATSLIARPLGANLAGLRTTWVLAMTTEASQ